MKLGLAFILGGSFRDDSDRRVAGSDHRSRLFKGNRFKGKACRMISPVKCKCIDRPGIWCTGRSHPAAPANVRDFSVRWVELQRCVDGRPDNLYNLRGCALRPPTQSVLIGGLPRTLSRGDFSLITASFTRCNFLHPLHLLANQVSGGRIKTGLPLHCVPD